MTLEYRKEGKIAIFTFNRPNALNAFNWEIHRELNEAIEDFDSDDNLRVGILTGAGDKAFSAGADLKSTGPPPEEIQNWEKGRKEKRVSQIWKPMIAAINGYCLGAGLELVLTCDIRIAAEHALLGLPEVARGLIADGGGTALLPRMIPRCLASEILLTGKHITAQEAFRMGLVNKVVPLDELMPTAMEWAELICKSAPLAVRATKEAVNRGIEMSLIDSMELGRKLAESVRLTEDYAEGRRAFAENREPEYKGR